MSPPLVTVAVWDFTPSKRSPLLGKAGEGVQGLVVRYRFLDVPVGDTETPYASPPPVTAEDSSDFNFVKVFHVNELKPDSQLHKVLHDQSESDSTSGLISRKTVTCCHENESSCENTDPQLLLFHLLSEPHDLASFEECTSIGKGSVSLKDIWRTRNDLEKDLVPVYSRNNNNAPDDPQLLGYFTVTVKICQALEYLSTNANPREG